MRHKSNARFLRGEREGGRGGEGGGGGVDVSAQLASDERMARELQESFVEEERHVVGGIPLLPSLPLHAVVLIADVGVGVGLHGRLSSDSCPPLPLISGGWRYLPLPPTLPAW